jgi:hypothetical protein
MSSGLMLATVRGVSKTDKSSPKTEEIGRTRGFTDWSTGTSATTKASRRSTSSFGDELTAAGAAAVVVAADAAIGAGAGVAEPVVEAGPDGLWASDPSKANIEHRGAVQISAINIIVPLLFIINFSTIVYVFTVNRVTSRRDKGLRWLRAALFEDLAGC